MRRIWSVFAIAILCAVVLPLAASAESVNVLQNGSFEDEFIYGVGKHWGSWNNGGLASYGYHDDVWEKVISDGAHSQLIEIHTNAVGGSQPERYSGIYQVANVVPGQRYMFSFYGMVRSTEGSEIRSRWNYRVQVGFDYAGGSNPEAVTEWIQMDWPEHWRLLPGRMQSFARGVTATGDKLTVFIRVLKKFPTVGEEANINIDAVSLVGPRAAGAPAEAKSPAVAEGEQPQETIPQTGGGYALPLAGASLAVVAIGLTIRRMRKQDV